MKPIHPQLTNIPTTMKPSKLIYEFVKAFESLHDGDLNQIGLQPKLDATGNWTEGYGRLMVRNGNALRVDNYPTVDSVMKFRTISNETQALAALMVDMDKTARGVLTRLKIKVSQHQFDALVSHAYNCGYSGTLYTLINGKAKEQSIKNWFTSKYITSRGVFLLGLQYRRNDEYEIWAGINYKREYKRSI